MTTRQEPRGSRSRAEGADGSYFGAAVFPALPLFGSEGGTSFDTPTIDSIDSDIRELADTVPHKMWFSGPHGGVLFLNARFTEYTGVPRENSYGMGWRDVVHPDDLTECLDVRKRDEAIRCRQPWHFAYRLRRHDGEYRWHTGRTVPLFDVAGVVRRWVGTSTDVQDEKDAAQRQHRFMRDLTEQRGMEEELKAALDKQSRVMETLQNSLLMVPPPDAFPGLAIKPLYESASDDTLVGGDFFDTFALAEDTIVLVVGDAMGHGIEAVTYTSEVKFALRVLLREYPQPAVAMERLNAFLVDKTQLAPSRTGNSYIALAVCVVDTRAQELSCAWAGIETPFVLRADTGEVTELMECGGPPLGISDDMEYRAQRVSLGVGDVLAMSTDGLTEARRYNSEGRIEFFGYDGLTSAVREEVARHPSSLGDAGVAVARRAREFGGGVINDDVCLLLARCTEKG